MTQFIFSRRSVAFRLFAAFPMFIYHAAGAAWDNLKANLSDFRADFIPAVRYVLTGTDVPGATRAAVKSGVSTAAVAVSSPIAAFWRKHIRNRLLSFGLFLALPALYVLLIAKTVYEEIDWADTFDIVKDLFLGIFDGRTV